MSTTAYPYKLDAFSSESLQKNIKAFCKTQEQKVTQIRERNQKDISTINACCVGFAAVTFASLMYMYGMGTPPSLPLMWIVGGSGVPAAYKLQQFFTNVSYNSFGRSQALITLRTNIDQKAKEEDKLETVEPATKPLDDETKTTEEQAASPQHDEKVDAGDTVTAEKPKETTDSKKDD